MRSRSNQLLGFPSTLVVLAACNQTFGLRETRALDAGQYDAPTDAPYACPPPGGSPPRFSSEVHQVFVGDCEGYSLSPAGVAIARCSVGGRPRISLGATDQPLTPAAGTWNELSNDIGVVGRLTADGKQLLLIQPRRSTLELYGRVDGEQWIGLGVPPIPVDAASRLSTVARSPTGWRTIVVELDGLHEWAYEGSAWSQVAFQPRSQLGASFLWLQLSSDGLRALLSGNENLFYTDRPSLDAPFRAATELVDMPATPNAFMTDDCARIYLTGLGSVFYVQQR